MLSFSRSESRCTAVCSYTGSREEGSGIRQAACSAGPANRRASTVSRVKGLSFRDEGLGFGVKESRCTAVCSYTCFGISYEKGIPSKPCGNKVYYPNASTLPVKNMLCSKFHCQTVLNVLPCTPVWGLPIGTLLNFIRRIVKQFRRGLVFTAHRLVYHSTLDWRVTNKTKVHPPTANRCTSTRRCTWTPRLRIPNPHPENSIAKP